jgi:transposase
VSRRHPAVALGGIPATTPGAAYKYSAFCEKYQQWAKRLKRSMRQIHEAGDKLLVDYASQTVPLVDASTGEITQAQVFVAVLGASNCTYACAMPTQKAADWVASSLPPWNSSAVYSTVIAIHCARMSIPIQKVLLYRR